MQNPSQPPQSAIAPSPSLTVNQVNTVFVGSLIVTLPILLLAGAMLYKQYLAVARRRQIATLERLWKLNTRERTS